MPNKDVKSVKDSRFSSIRTDPRFKLPKKKSIRGELDSRFKDALKTDERFNKKAHIDKYGKKIKGHEVKEELSKYYNFEDEEGAMNSSGDSVSGSDSEEESEHSSASSASSAGEKDAVSKRQPSMREMMRGEGLESSDESSEEDDDTDEGESESELINQADEYERVRASADVVPQGDASNRLAVVNLDWDNITSTDLMATFSSFLPPSRSIMSVKIYPSEYGKKQMAIEEMNGPAQNLFDEQSSTVDQRKSKQVDNDGEEDYSSSKLRRYQLQRLQYFYAVVECDSVECASTIYSSCDGTEYESTANFFDLRFIPDEVDFSGDEPRDECFKVPASYKPSNFTTDALQHSKVKLTWDETPKERARIAQKAFSNKDIEADDIKAYLASESDDEDEESIAQRYRSLLSNSNDGDSFGNDRASITKGAESGDDAVEITFNPVLEGKEAKLEIIDNNKPTGGAQGENPEDNLSTIEKYKLKEKQRKLRRMENYRTRKAAENEELKRSSESDKASLELLAMDDELLNIPEATKEPPKSDQKSRKLTKRATKKKAEAEAEADFDTADPRFQALFDDPDFAIDSTVPQFKKTKGMDKIISERRKRQSSSERQGKITKNKRKFQPSEESTGALVSKLRRKHGKN